MHDLKSHFARSLICNGEVGERWQERIRCRSGHIIVPENNLHVIPPVCCVLAALGKILDTLTYVASHTAAATGAALPFFTV